MTSTESVGTVTSKEVESIGPFRLDTIQCMDCVEGMRSIPNDSVDLVVTSPPYDMTRDYKGFSYNLHDTGVEVFRVLKAGGIAVMVVQDQTKDFGKTLTSFRTIVDWCDNIGFKLFECLIYRKHGSEGAWWKARFRVDHEYMPVFLKGARPQYFNKDKLLVPSKHGGKTMTGSGNRKTNGETSKTIRRVINPLKCRGTVWREDVVGSSMGVMSENELDPNPLGSVWDYLMAGDKNPIKRKHPAPFPDKIPYDFIQCFCPSDGIVLDPFIGSGSTAVSAMRLGRHFIGFDISKEYCSIAEERIRNTSSNGSLFTEENLVPPK